MDFLELIKRRKSIREYKDLPLKRDDILKCIEAARLAPSACNAQPWHYIIVDDRYVIEKISTEALHTVYSFNRFVEDAGALVVIVSNKEGFNRFVGKKIKGTDYYLIDIGIAGEHLVLQAEELGIGTCWIGWFDEGRLRKILNVPKNRRIDVMISMGYSDEGVDGKKDRKPLEDIVSFNGF